MQGPAHHVSPIKNWKQLVVVVVLAFLVPISVIILLSQYVTDVSTASDTDGSAVLSRIKPVGEVLIEPASGGKSAEAPAASADGAKAAAAPAPSVATTAAAPATASAAPATSVAAAATPTAAAAATSAKPDGKKIYDTTCTACHGTGVAGAPKFGDKAAWAPRIKLGIDALHASALKGKGAMPPKGGNVSLPDADVIAAVDYMVAAAK
jgi:cytochrome c5